MFLHFIKANHIVIQSDASTINKVVEVELDNNVIGISIENDPTSTGNLEYGLDEAPKIVMLPGDPARAYGGFQANNFPMLYKGKLRYRFTNIGKGLIILHYFTPQTKEVC